jgi:hypothetical protein
MKVKYQSYEQIVIVAIEYNLSRLFTPGGPCTFCEPKFGSVFRPVLQCEPLPTGFGLLASQSAIRALQVSTSAFSPSTSLQAYCGLVTGVLRGKVMASVLVHVFAFPVRPYLCRPDWVPILGQPGTFVREPILDSHVSPSLLSASRFSVQQGPHAGWIGGSTRGLIGGTPHWA